jgi:hypothetical protein
MLIGLISLARRKMMKICLYLLMAFLLTACGSQTPADGVSSGSSVIQWDRGPQTIVFRADVVGGDTANTFRSRNEVPICTIYGDNRIVWTNELSNFETQVLWDQLTDQQIQDFVSYLTIVQRIYTYDAQADLQPPSAVEPVVETLTVFVNGRVHTTDSFAAWENDYFQSIIRTCKTISATPVLFEPQGAWVSAQVTEYNSNIPGLLWDGNAAGLRLADLASSGERKWITDQNLRILWNIMRTSSPLTLFNEGEATYQVALEVPGVNRDAPPAP